MNGVSGGQVDNNNERVWGNGNVAGGRDREAECYSVFIMISFLSL